MDLRILACDDNIIQLNNLVKSVKKYGKNKGIGLEIDTTRESRKVLELNSNNDYDLIFLDINIDDMTGIEIGKSIREYDEDTVIIFVTAHPNFSKEAYELFAFNYILKPIETIFFEKVMNRAVELIKTKQLSKNELFVNIRDGFQSHKLYYNEIIAAEKQGKRVYIYLTKGRAVNPVLTLNDFEESLDKKYFIRCHKTYIVNKYKIKSLQPNYLEMEGIKKEIPIGRKYKEIIEKMIYEMI
jgi:DNA-binding LytR/AlgR family response regulator